MKTPNEIDLNDVLDKGVFRELQEERWSEIPFWIPTGCVSLDYATAGFLRGKKGGIPHGRAVEIWGPESAGKSALLDHIIREFLNLGGVVLLGDREHSHEESRLLQVGIDPTNLRFVERPKEKLKPGQVPSDFNLEEFFELTSKGFKKIRSTYPDVPVLVALDSLAVTPTKEQQDKEFGEQSMRDRLDKSIAMSNMFPEFCSDITTSNATFVVVNQLRQKPGVLFGDPDYSPGGNAKNFNFSLRIKLGSGSQVLGADDPSRKTEEPDTVGLLCSFKVMKNKVAPPMRRGHFFLMFDDRGIFHEATFAQMLIDRKRADGENPFEKSGTWYSWEGERIGQGMKGMTKFFLENPDVMLEIEQQLFLEEVEE